jgi:riboflavin kinase/FMN adenylyltransferase
VGTELIRGLYNLPADFAGCVATIGNFDGVHLGHQALLDEVKARAKHLGVPAAVIIFEPQPGEFFAEAGKIFPRLTRWREKFQALAHCGIDKVILLRFDRKLADLSAEDFIQQILYEGLRVKQVVVGDDFRFGKGRRGDFNFLQSAGQRLGFEVADIPTFLMDNERVSSTRIRKALEQGDHALAQILLGHPYTMQGRIVHGNKLGRKLGFPTANIDVGRDVTPVDGVYIVRMHGVGDTALPGVANVGTRPTVDGTHNLLEVHLFDFNQDIYGKHVCVEFCEKIRAEVRYENLDLLVQQMEKDAVVARAYFTAHKQTFSR